VCVTYPGRIVEIVDGMAVVDLQGRRLRASLVVVPTAVAGDWVIVAAGTVLEIVEPEGAAEIRAILGEPTQAEPSQEEIRP
jgi:hydrogenase expression/formation protein HypC